MHDQPYNKDQTHTQDGLKHDRKPQNLEKRSAAGVTAQRSQSGRTPGGSCRTVLNPTRNLPKRFHRGPIPPRPEAPKADKIW